MSHKYYEFSLHARRWKKWRSGKTPSVVVHRLVARSKFDALLKFQNSHARWTVVSCVRGRLVKEAGS